jgi:hypothetical protein
MNSNHQLVAPNSIRSLALDLLLQRVRNGELTETRALELHERMTEIKLRLLGDRVSRRTAFQMATAQRWATLQLAEYVAVAKLQADVLIAVDPDLALKASGTVPLATIADLMA